jgi:5,10-methylenetetrahydromethanopterin reductase
MKRIGIALLPEIFPSNLIVRYGLKAERSGFHSIWIPEHYFFRDSFTILGAISILTKKIKLATGIISLYTRHPALIAMSFACLNELSGGRAIAGVGLGVSSWLQKMGIKANFRPVQVKEMVKVLKKLMKNERVTYRSRHFSLFDVGLNFNVSDIPLYLAAVNIKMLETAGEVADGVLLTAGCSPKYVSMARKRIEVGISKRENSSQFDVAAIILTSISRNSYKAKNSIKRIIASLLARPGRAKLMLDENQINTKMFKKFEKLAIGGDIDKAHAYLTFDIVDSLSASGTIKECEDKIEQYREYGVDLPILMPVNLTSLKYLVSGKLQ